MAREINFAYGTIVPSSWLNDMQDLQSAQILGVTVRSSGTLLYINPAGDGSATGQSSANINGQPYHINAQIQRDMTGQANGNYYVYVVPGTSGAFAIAVAPTGSGAPAGSRGPVASFTWTSPSITNLVNAVDAVPGHAGSHATGGVDAITPAMIGAASAAADTNTAAVIASGFLQSGIVSGTDLVASAISVSSSGVLSVSFSANSRPVWVQATSGALVPISYPGGMFTAQLQSMGNAQAEGIYGVEIDTAGVPHLVNFGSVYGPGVASPGVPITNANLASPAVTAGRMRIVDIAIYQPTTTTYQLAMSSTPTQGTNWMDRRLWAGGVGPWQTSLTIVNPTLYGPGYVTPKYRIVGDEVEFRGDYSNISGSNISAAGGGAATEIASLPWTPGFVPSVSGNPYQAVAHVQSSIVDPMVVGLALVNQGGLPTLTVVMGAAGWPNGGHLYLTNQRFPLSNA